MCVHPINIKDSVGHYKLVGCGKCAQCIKSKQNVWYMRAVEESNYYQSSQLSPRYKTMYFLTMTYDDAHLPYVVTNDICQYPKLQYDDVNKMWRTFKMWLKTKGEERDWSYMFCGEFGHKYGRPHYHCLVYGLSQYDIVYLKNWWLKHYAPKAVDTMEAFEMRSGRNSKQIGFVSKRCQNTPDDYRRVAKYVSKYVAKGDYDRWRSDRPLSPIPRVYASRGFGSKTIDKWNDLVPVYMRTHEKRRWKYSDVALLHSRLMWHYGFIPAVGSQVSSPLPAWFLDRMTYLKKPVRYDSKLFMSEINGKYVRSYRTVAHKVDESQESLFDSRRPIQVCETLSGELVEVSRPCRGGYTQKEVSLRGALLSYSQNENDCRRDESVILQGLHLENPDYLVLSRQLDDVERRDREQLCERLDGQLLDFYSSAKDNQ